MSIELNKYEGLGNDYLVHDPGLAEVDWSESLVRQVCDRHFGAGSDGILVGPILAGTADFASLCSGAGVSCDVDVYCGVRILNPDGSEAEKSGNGLRIFAQWLYDHGHLSSGVPVRLLTLGGVVSATVLDPGKAIRIAMGGVTFSSSRIPVLGAERQVLSEPIEVGGRAFAYSAASVGNPHCVVPVEDLSRELALTYGPLLEVEPRFPQRTNVQFMKVLDGHRIALEIWERGAGYTLASGSSSSAAAAVAVRLGLCASPVTVCMPGGRLTIEIDEDWQVVLTGPAGHVCDVRWP